MNIDDLTLGQIKEISNLSLGAANSPKSHKMLGMKVVVRTYSAGVHVGTLEEKDGTDVMLSNSHRIYSWKGAFTLSEVATKGIAKGSRVSCELPVIALTQAIEIIQINDEALKKVLSYVE